MGTAKQMRNMALGSVVGTALLLSATHSWPRASTRTPSMKAGPPGRRTTGLAACLEAIPPGDTLVGRKLDRLGRDLRHLVSIVHDLTERGIGLKVLTGQGSAIDTTTASGKLVFRIFAARDFTVLRVLRTS